MGRVSRGRLGSTYALEWITSRSSAVGETDAASTPLMRTECTVRSAACSVMLVVGCSSSYPMPVRKGTHTQHPTIITSAIS